MAKANTATKRPYKRKANNSSNKVNGSNINLNLPVATFDTFKLYKAEKSQIKEVNLPEIGGKVFVLPLSSSKFRELIKIRDLGDLCHEAATFMSNNVYSDPEGKKLLCNDYNLWMSLTPGQLTDIFNYIGDCLQDGGDEKNV